jgi:hypothetical protein
MPKNGTHSPYSFARLPDFEINGRPVFIASTLAGPKAMLVQEHILFIIDTGDPARNRRAVEKALDELTFQVIEER